WPSRLKASRAAWPSDCALNTTQWAVALLSDMNQPLGFAVGNALEVREGVMPLLPPAPSRNGEIIEETIELDETLLALRLIERHVEPRKVNLKGARVIAAGGGGVGSKADFRLIHDLASAIGGAVGASRAAVDSGYIGKEHQIGQTGTTVRPALYIAAGISGAVQHRAGMEESAKIIAINTDPEAPIFSVAHYGIVGDLKKVLPMMIKALKERR
ncbi:MAG TPA: hypothetical protein EYP14_19580, partial [Planctomycetaceae bacterium]|nr:hypothetical protein [Planctomycetaceae bacterium]